MTNRVRLLFLLVGAAISSNCSGPSDEPEGSFVQALTVTVNPPNQGQPYNVYVGQSFSNGAPVVPNTYVVVYRDVYAGTCVWMQGLGDTGGFTSDIVVHGTGYGDSFEVPSSQTSTPIWCYEQPSWKQYQLGPMHAGPGYHGKSVVLHGDGGGEFMTCSANGTPVICYGDAGDDYLETVTGDGEMHGGAGNDRLIGQAVDNSRSRMYGEEGDDCLFYPSNDRPLTYDCGPGTGDRSHGVWGNNGCEAYATSCP